DDRTVHDARAEVALRVRPHTMLQHGVAVEGGADHPVEVAREAFGEPEVVPVALGDGVAEPLVRGLVADDALTHAPLEVRPVGVEDALAFSMPPNLVADST